MPTKLSKKNIKTVINTLQTYLDDLTKSKKKFAADSKERAKLEAAYRQTTKSLLKQFKPPFNFENVLSDDQNLFTTTHAALQKLIKEIELDLKGENDLIKQTNAASQHILESISGSGSRKSPPPSRPVPKLALENQLEYINKNLQIIRSNLDNAKKFQADNKEKFDELNGKLSDLDFKLLERERPKEKDSAKINALEQKVMNLKREVKTELKAAGIAFEEFQNSSTMSTTQENKHSLFDNNNENISSNTTKGKSPDISEKHQAQQPKSSPTQAQSSYKVVIDKKTLAKIEEYKNKILQGEQIAGSRLEKAISQISPPLSTEKFIDALINTKVPQIFAESNAVKGNGQDWNETELSILGDINMVVPVTIFDDGLHRNEKNQKNEVVQSIKTHDKPFQGTLLFTPGALLQGAGGISDRREVLSHDKKIDQEGYYQLYERRLLPVLMEANRIAGENGTKAFVTIPGMGCGAFAGSLGNKKILEPALKDVVEKILERHGSKLNNIQAVHLDTYKDLENDTKDIHGINFRVRTFKNAPEGQGKPQLLHPQQYQEANDNFSQCELFSVVAWDHVSWPGNDFYAGSRLTDDGVKAAATNTMQVMTGIEGQYDKEQHKYNPPEEYTNWDELIKKNNTALKTHGKIFVHADGEMLKLEANQLVASKQQTQATPLSTTDIQDRWNPLIQKAKTLQSNLDEEAKSSQISQEQKAMFGKLRLLLDDSIQGMKKNLANANFNTITGKLNQFGTELNTIEKTFQEIQAISTTQETKHSLFDNNNENISFNKGKEKLPDVEQQKPDTIPPPPLPESNTIPGQPTRSFALPTDKELENQRKSLRPTPSLESHKQDKQSRIIAQHWNMSMIDKAKQNEPEKTNTNEIEDNWDDIPPTSTSTQQSQTESQKAKVEQNKADSGTPSTPTSGIKSSLKEKGKEAIGAIKKKVRIKESSKVEENSDNKL
ncbi:MAG: DUF4804 domain-containing protein, partial [Gammaproteobacteria bacterium]